MINFKMILILTLYYRIIHLIAKFNSNYLVKNYIFKANKKFMVKNLTIKKLKFI
jgi:hypothetical protein